MEKVKDNPAVILIDYKMKFECECYREKTSEFYGKKGFSWHGGMIYSRCTQAEKDEEDEGTLLPFKINYVDHMSSGDSKQDWKEFASYFEAILILIKKFLPHVNELYLQSDNSNFTNRQ